MFINNYFKKLLTEIETSISLRVLGAGLSLVQVHTAIVWFFLRQHLLYGNEYSHVCWSYFPNCHNYLFKSESTHTAAGVVLGLLGLVGATLFWKRSTVKWGLWLLTISASYKFYLYSLDFMLMGNYHYMPFFLTGVYLLFPYKHYAVQMCLVLFYFYAGLLKGNQEWLSGSAIPIRWIQPGSPMRLLLQYKLLPVACIYVYFLETVFVFGLLSSRALLFWGVLLQFIVFHLMSYWVVGSYYPISMFLMLIYWPFFWWFDKDKLLQFSYQNILRNPRMYISTAVLVLIFTVCQMIPRLNKGESALTGEGRMFSLHMFDVLSTCESKAIVSFKTKKIDVSIKKEDHIKTVRKQCDPLIYFYKAKYFCEVYKGDPEFLGVHLSLVSRKTTDKEYRKIVSLENVCDPKYTYSSLGFNDWIMW